jgi:peptide/nickel transport system permease protein
VARYVLRRVLLALPALLGLVLLTFVLVRVVPADPAATLAGDAATPAQIAEIRARYGLDQPLWKQAVTHVRQVLTGDLGSSIFSGRPVIEEIAFRLPPSGDAGADLCRVAALGRARCAAGAGGGAEP